MRSPSNIGASGDKRATQVHLHSQRLLGQATARAAAPSSML